VSQAEAQRLPDAWRLVRKVLKWLGFTILGLCGVACLLFAVAFVINLRDEPLTPQTRALLTPAPNPYGPEDNIYVALAGLHAPIGATVIADGEARVEAHNRRVDAYQSHPSQRALDALIHEPEDPRQLQFQGDCHFLEPLNGSIWSAALEHREEVDRLLAENRELYQRYLELSGLHGYYETARPSLLLMNLRWPSQLRPLFLAVVALRMRSGIPDEQKSGLTDLERDVQLWRTVLTGEGSMLSSMLSTAFLQEDYLVLADMIADGRLRLPPGATEGDVVAPVFDLRDWDLSRSLVAGFRVMSSALRTDVAVGAGAPADWQRPAVSGWLTQLDDRLGDHFLKVNATLNLSARETERRMVAAADPAQLYRMKAERGVFAEGQSAWTLPLSYNPVGKILTAVSAPVYDDYSLRAWDAAALQKLVRLSYEIRRQRIEPSAVPAFLRQHPEWSTHPADGRPFLWNPAKNELRVQTVGKQQPGRRFSVPIWRSPAQR